MQVGYNNYDATLIKTGNPSATATTTTSSGVLDLGEIDKLGVRSERFELEVCLPATTTTHLPANTTMTFKLVCSDDANFTSSETRGTWTYSGGTAHVMTLERYAPTLKDKRYWKVTATGTVTSTGAIGASIANLVYSLSYVC